MIEITVDTIYSFIEGKFPFPEIDKALSWYVEGYWNTLAYKKRFWDGKKHLFKHTKDGRGKFPTGVLDSVCKVLRRENFEYNIVDKRPSIGIPLELPLLSGIDKEQWKPDGNREYQADCILKAVKIQRGIIWLPTNAGKTEVCIGIVAAFGVRTAIIVHTTKLLTQTKERFEKRLQKPIGVIGAGVWDPKDITIAMIQTLHKRKKSAKTIKWQKSIQCLIIDEAHHTSASSYYKFAMGCPALFRFGVSATAFTKGENTEMLLRAATGPLLMKMSQTELIESKISVKPIIRMIEVNKPSVHFFGGHPISDWISLERELICNNNYRNMLISKFALYFYKKGLSTLILVDKIEHGKRLDTMLEEELGTSTLHKFIWGKTPEFAREKAEKAFRSKSIHILIASKIYGEGVDIPEIEAMIIAGGGTSETSTIQKIGRGLRQNDKGEVQIIDFIDNTHTTLLKHSRHRRRIYKAEEAFEVRTIEEDQISKELSDVST